MTPVAGHTAVLKIGTITVPAMDWKLDIDPKMKDASNFATGRLKVATLGDCKLTCKVVWDDSSLPTDPAGLNLVDGTIVTAKCYVNATQFFSVPGVVSKLTPAVSGQEDILMLDVEIDLSNGTVTYPVIP